MSLDPSLNPNIPNIPLNITSTPVKARSRVLKHTWSPESVDDLRYFPFKRPDNALDLLKDALVDPDYDPSSDESYKGLYRWPDGRVATPEEIKDHSEGSNSRLVSRMADEMAAEIDAEIMRDLGF